MRRGALFGSVTARAPSSTANLGPGYDVFGLALDAFFDEVTIEAVGGGGGGRIAMAKPGRGAPAAVRRNTAGLVVSEMAAEFGTACGLRVHVTKGVPAGYGMGSSAASAAAAAVAFNRMFGLGLGPDELVRFAGAGEAASAGTAHYDNAAASVLGGFVIVKPSPLEVVPTGVPRGLHACVAIPDVRVPPSKTAVSRGAVPRRVPLAGCTANLASAAALVAAIMRGDAAGVGRAAGSDSIVEPAREHMIPGYRAVKAAAGAAGAAGAAISGAGPSVVAFAASRRLARAAGAAMQDAFAAAGVGSRAVPCRPCGGARVAGTGGRLAQAGARGSGAAGARGQGR